MRTLVWLVRGFIFFTLFAFALNNQQEAVLHWFFGAQWRAPMVIVVLAAFAAGSTIGVLAMLPSWWRARQQMRRSRESLDTVPSNLATAPARLVTEPGAVHPPREGL